jgi:hypothetical protein
MSGELSNNEHDVLERVKRRQAEHRENQNLDGTSAYTSISSNIYMDSNPLNLYKIWKAMSDLVHHIADNLNKVIEGRGTPLNDLEFIGEVGLAGIATGAAIGAGTAAAMGIGEEALAWAATGALYGAIDGPILGGLLAAAAEYSVRDR